MKKTLLLLCLSALTFFTRAQIKLDSIVHPQSSKTTYWYNAAGQVTEHIVQTWGPTPAGDWKNYSRRLYTYDANGALLEFTLQYRNMATGDWRNDTQYLNTYDANGSLTQRTFLIWEETANAWQGNSRETWTANESTREGWNDDANNWEFRSKKAMLSNTQGQVVELIQYYWEDNGWIIEPIGSRSTWDYDAQGNLIETTSSNWDEVLSVWENHHRTSQAFDAENKLIEQATYFWSGNDWAGSRKIIYHYFPNDSLSGTDIYSFSPDLPELWYFDHPGFRYTYNYAPTGELIEQINSGWNADLNTITDLYRWTYAYDLDGNVLDFAFYTHDFAAGTWRKDIREINEYDLSTNAADLVYPEDLANLFAQAQLVSKATYSTDGLPTSDWQLYDEAYYYFSEFITATHEAPGAAALQLFPNPVGDLLTLAANPLSASAYQITDLNGRMLQQEKSWNGTGIDVSRLAAGSYCIRLTEGAGTLVAKFVKH